MSLKDEVENNVLGYIDSGGHAKGAAIDVRLRNLAAIDADPQFFNDATRQQLADTVENICLSAFGKWAAKYRNYRANNGRPFIAIKIQPNRWPHTKSEKAKLNNNFYKPLEALGLTSDNVKKMKSGAVVIRIY